MIEPRFARFADGLRQSTGKLEAILLAVGTASMCWEHVDRAGVFQSEDASAIADLLHAHLFGDPIVEYAVQAAVDRAAANPGTTVHVAGGYVTSEHGPEIIRGER